MILRRCFLCWLVFGVLSCEPTAGPRSAGDGPLYVVATTSIIADAVRQVGGTHVDVYALMPPGTDPHSYVPTPQDALRLAQAHLIFSNGLHLEGKMAQLLEQRSGGPKAVAVTARLDPGQDLRPVDDDETSHDPHVWFDVMLWIKCVELMRDTLAEFDPAHAPSYQANAESYIAQLRALDHELKHLAAKIPAPRRVLVTSHDAFGYWGRAYGFEVRGLQGVSTAAALSSRDRESLAKFLGQRRVPVVFTETSVPSKGLRAVLETCLSSYNHQVKLVGESDSLYSDSLGPEGSPGATYLGMLRHNMNTIVKHLQ